jgi:hypothetical protein
MKSPRKEDGFLVRKNEVGQDIEYGHFKQNRKCI